MRLFKKPSSVLLCLLLSGAGNAWSSPYVVSAPSESWDNTTPVITDDIIIPEGVVLTIKANATLHMGRDKHIQLMGAGSRLVLLGKITNVTSDINGFYWGGIILNGNNGPQDPAQQPSFEISGGIIEFAIIGVDIIRGGIVNTGESMQGKAVFRNNRKSMQFSSYNDPTSEATNLSSIRNTIFECTEAYPLNSSYAGSGTTAFITMWNVRGVEITGNIFRNTVPHGIFSNGYRGLGIGSIDASYDVYGDPDSCAISGRGNQFTGLSKGIEISNNLQAGEGRRIRICDNTFTDVEKAVSLSNTSDNVIYRNTFTWTGDFVNEYFASVPEKDLWVIYAGSSSYLDIIENTIDLDPVDFTGYRVNVLYIDHSKGPVNISGNLISAKLSSAGALHDLTGTLFTGDNAEVQVYCNVYRQMKRDWEIAAYSDVYRVKGNGLADQGIRDGASMNEFSGGNSAGIVNDKDALTIYYAYSAALSSSSFLPVNNSGKLVLIARQLEHQCVTADACKIYAAWPGRSPAPILIENNFTVYPNPNPGLFYLEFDLKKNYDHPEIILTDGIGRSIETRALIGLNGTIAIVREELASGIYHLSVKDGGQRLFAANVLVIR